MVFSVLTRRREEKREERCIQIRNNHMFFSLFFWFTSSVSTLQSMDLDASEVLEAEIVDAAEVCCTSRSGVEVMVDNGEVYH